MAAGAAAGAAPRREAACGIEWRYGQAETGEGSHGASGRDSASMEADGPRASSAGGWGADSRGAAGVEVSPGVDAAGTGRAGRLEWSEEAPPTTPVDRPGRINQI